MFNKKTRILITILFFFSIISVYWIYTKTKSTTQIIKPTPIPVKYEFIKAIPQTGSVSTIPATSAIEFYFTKPIQEGSADVIISPETSLTFSSDSVLKSFYIRAVPAWKLGVKYNIKVNIRSESGEILQEPINYSFELKQMKDSLLTE